MKIEPGKNYCANCIWWTRSNETKGECTNEKRSNTIGIINYSTNKVTMVGSATPNTPENYTCFYHEKNS